MISIDKSSQGKRISAKIGDVIKVQLAENPSAGYIWKINSIDDKHLNPTEDRYEIQDEAIGAGGMKTFYIEVIDEGISELGMGLGNPWEKDSVDTFKVTIESNKD